MRVTHLITTLDVGGAEVALSRLLPALARRGIESRVTCMTEAGPIADRLRSAGIPVDALNMRRGRPHPTALYRFMRHLQQTRPDVLQTWLYHADLFGTVAARLSGVPRLAWNIRAADMKWDRYRALSLLTQRVCARLSRIPDVVVVNSEAGLAHHAAIGYRPRAWRVIPNGIDPTVFRPDPQARARLRRAWGISDDAPVIGMLARLDAMKDHGTFLAAAARCAAAAGDVHFVLAGDGVEPDQLPWPGGVRARLLPRLHCLGRVDAAPVLAALDVCTLTSVSEGFPNVVVEAMATGVPCVATDVGDVRRILGDTGIAVAPRDVTALADAWLALAADPTARLRRGAAARARAVSCYSLDGVVAMYEALYLNLVSDGVTE